MAIAGNYLYLATGHTGLCIVDITNPDSACVVGEFCRPGYATTLIRSGNRFLIGGYNRGLEFAEIDANDSLVSTGYASTNDPITGMAIYNNYLYATDYHQGLIYHLDSLATRPPDTMLTQHDLMHDIAVSGHYAYIVGENRKFCIVDLAIPTAPAIVCSLAFNWFPYKIVVNGDYAYLGGSEYPLRIYNIANPAHPVLIDSTYSFFNQSFAVQNNFVYIVNGSGLTILNVNNPGAPTIVGSYSQRWWANDIAVSGNYAFITNGRPGGNYQNRLSVVNIANPAAPRLVGYYNTFDPASGILVSGDTVYLAAGQEFGIYDCSQALGVVDRSSESIPASFELKPNYPNPFNATTELKYSIAHEGKVSLKIFDITGREVAKLIDFHQNPGEYVVHFDGKSLSSGTYFARLQAGEFSQTQKLVLLK